MTIPTTQYKNHILHAYAQRIFPNYHDPYASGAKQFSCVVRIDACPPNQSVSQRYAVPSDGMFPATSMEAFDMAFRHGEDIIDGKASGLPL